MNASRHDPYARNTLPSSGNGPRRRRVVTLAPPAPQVSDASTATPAWRRREPYEQAPRVIDFDTRQA